MEARLPGPPPAPPQPRTRPRRLTPPRPPHRSQPPPPSSSRRRRRRPRKPAPSPSHPQGPRAGAHFRPARRGAEAVRHGARGGGALLRVSSGCRRGDSRRVGGWWGPLVSASRRRLRLLRHAVALCRRWYTAHMTARGRAEGGTAAHAACA